MSLFYMFKIADLKVKCKSNIKYFYVMKIILRLCVVRN